MDAFDLFTYWLTLFSIGFTFLPIFVILDWRQRGTAEGFSSINFVLPLLMMGCWYRHGVLANDAVNIYLNAINMAVFAFYVAAFAYYQPKRRYLYGQLMMLFATVYTLFRYVDSHPSAEQAEVMAAVAALTQVAGLVGPIYDIKRALSLKTTEYIPAQIQFGVFALTLQWSLFGILVGNYWMTLANIAGLVVNIYTIYLYIKHPPETWIVPIFGVGGAKAPKKKQ